MQKDRKRSGFLWGEKGTHQFSAEIVENFGTRSLAIRAGAFGLDPLRDARIAEGMETGIRERGVLDGRQFETDRTGIRRPAKKSKI